MRHPLHAICPYFAMFPELFVRKHLIGSKPGDLVLDPFSGRGTTAFESLLNNRRAIALDINPVAVCVSRAKTNSPIKAKLLSRLSQLRREYAPVESATEQDNFFAACFHISTLRQVLYMRHHLKWRRRKEDCFLAALMLGRLHGESHKSPQYLSNRMPRTISTKPAYSIRWWNENGYVAPERNLFDILEREIDFRYSCPSPQGMAHVRQGDVRKAGGIFADFAGQCKLVITSPPYLDTTNFAEDQWLRLWFLGGQPRPNSKNEGDDRHSSVTNYWAFLRDSWAGIDSLLAKKARIVVRIGGKKLDFDQATDGLTRSLEEGLGRRVVLKQRTRSEIKDGQLRSFRPNAAGTKREFDFCFQLS